MEQTLKRTRRLLGCMALLGCAGCNVLGLTFPTYPLEGTYVLRGIAGKRLPQPSALGPSYEAGSILLREDGTFVDVIQLGGVVDSVRGTYTRADDTLHMHPQGWSDYIARWDSYGYLRVTWAEGEFTYVREK